MAVSHSALLAFTRAGYRVRLVHPEGFDLDPDVMEHAREHAGDRLTVHSDMDEGLAGAQVIYAKSWGAISEYAATPRRDHLRDWIVDQRPRARWLHHRSTSASSCGCRTRWVR